ncbi:carboxypeptidase-like regulatory domain-containing protein [Sphingobacterium faecium]|uniref:carboxypeptidase-like regulatory domain-containing protein n=1 Tax=Sphingobacterium faecium TaxID=34087 RepID=UPI00320A6C0D
MKLIILIFLIYLSNQLFAQQVNGLVLDEKTKKPIVNARVATSSYGTFTTATGSFNLNNVPFGETITVNIMGYESYHFKYKNTAKSDTVVILLKISPIALNEVTIKAGRNYIQDSLNRREEYASIFAYKAPTVKDIFIPKSFNTTTHYSPFQNSTSSLVSVNLLSVVSLLTKNKTATSKMKIKLLKEEEYQYVDQVFSRKKVQSITTLKGDSLQNFMNAYRPSIDEVKQMTDYQLLLYIKKSYDEFIKTYKPESFHLLNK